MAIKRIVVYLPGACSLLSLGAIDAPFRLLNSWSADKKYQLTYLCDDTSLAGNVETLTGNAATDLVAGSIDLLIVISDSAPSAPLNPGQSQRIRRVCEPSKGGILTCGAGAYWLAEAGVVKQSTLCIASAFADDFQLRFPNIGIAQNLYQLDAPVMSCSGATAILDALLTYLQRFETPETVWQLAQRLQLDRIRSADEPQPHHLSGVALEPRLLQALELMEQNLEEPLSTEAIAEAVNISRRQLERLFRRYLDNMPAKYYLQLRLKKARQLLLESNISIVQIGLSCGFSSGPHFSSAYKSCFGITPRDERSKRFATINPRHKGQNL